MADPNDPQIARLAARLGEAITTEVELEMAEECLDAAWSWVCSYGKPEWSFNDPTTPSFAKMVALSAAHRAYQNIGGFIEERADSVTAQRAPDYAKGTELTRQEIAGIRREAGSAGRVVSLQLTNPDIFPSRGKRSESQIRTIRWGVGDPYSQPIQIPFWGF